MAEPETPCCYWVSGTAKKTIPRKPMDGDPRHGYAIPGWVQNITLVSNNNIFLKTNLSKILARRKKFPPGR
jgi:hypothetical protein